MGIVSSKVLSYPMILPKSGLAPIPYNKFSSCQEKIFTVYEPYPKVEVS